MNFKLDKELFFEIPICFDRTQLSAVDETLFCNYPRVVQYLPEITNIVKSMFPDSFVSFVTNTVKSVHPDYFVSYFIISQTK